MAVVNAIGLPDTSPFRDTNQIPLPDDPPIEVQAKDQSKEANEEEGGERGGGGGQPRHDGVVPRN